MEDGPIDGVDGLLVDEELVILACPQWIYALDRKTGRLVWDTEFVEDTGDAPVHAAIRGIAFRGPPCSGGT